MISVKNLNYHYHHHPVLNAVTFEVEKGECVCILGENGAGKSTLIKCLMGVLKTHKQIKIKDTYAENILPHEWPKQVSYIPQTIKGVDMSVFESVLLGRKPYMRFKASQEDLNTVNYYMACLELTHLANRKLYTLSGGEKQRVAIARALAQEADILIMDEPTSSLDIKQQQIIIKEIKKIKATQNKTIIVVMHDLNLALSFADKFMFLKDGQLLAYGNHDVVCETLIEKTYDIKTTCIHNGAQMVVMAR